MTHRWVDYLFLLIMIVLTVYGQMILKWRMDQLGALPPGFWPGLRHLIGLLVDPAIVSSFVAAFIASLAWMAAMTRFELSYAYPFTSLNFVVVLILSVWLLNEQLTVQKVVGIALIMLGTAVASARSA